MITVEEKKMSQGGVCHRIIKAHRRNERISPSPRPNADDVTTLPSLVAYISRATFCPKPKRCRLNLMPRSKHAKHKNNPRASTYTFARRGREDALPLITLPAVAGVGDGELLLQVSDGDAYTRLDSAHVIAEADSPPCLSTFPRLMWMSTSSGSSSAATLKCCAASISLPWERKRAAVAVVAVGARVRAYCKSVRCRCFVVAGKL